VDDQAAILTACVRQGHSDQAQLNACLDAKTAELRRLSDTLGVDGAINALPPSTPVEVVTVPASPVPEPRIAEAADNRPANSGAVWAWLAVLGLVAVPVASYLYLAAERRQWTTEDARRRSERDAAGVRREEEAPRRAQERAHSAGRRPHALDPHSILGVPQTASQDQIKAAYRALIIRYHPDKVAQLGPELRALAEKKSQEINDAYRSLRR
jgi:hypothetical protein